MAWVTIATTRTDVDSPVTQDLMQDIVNNFTGLANGDAGAPRILNEALNSFDRTSASGNVCQVCHGWSYQTVAGSSSRTNVLEAVIQADGAYTFKAASYCTSAGSGANYQLHLQENGVDKVSGGSTTGAGAGFFSYITYTATLTAGDVIRLNPSGDNLTATSNHMFFMVAETDNADDSPDKIVISGK